MNKALVCVCLVLTSFSTFAQEALTPIPSLNVARYMGVWYEIAKYPNFFQRKCISNTVAQYNPQPDGTVRVFNSCTQEDGKTIDATGQARQIGEASSPKLEVRFAPDWLSFLPFVWGNYWVIDIDTDYQLVAVSEPKREYLWVLSRTPTVSAKTYDELMVRLRAKSLDTSKLERTRQGP